MLRKIHVTGVVQGVGFRPFVYQIATRANLAGWVANTSAGVDIEVEGDAPTLDAFLRALTDEKPPQARFDAVQVQDLASPGPAHYTGFEIRSSVTLEGAFQPISPDLSICPDCLRELFDPNDRRYLYPFINCTNCGPRFTIIQDIPYDRPNTTMRMFAMCEDCAREYHDPLNRRFHAQPVACARCGPKVWLEGGADHRVNSGTDPLESTRNLLGKGAIVAIKGLGGFHLACDATNPRAVSELRWRKLRVDKPFALMMPDVATVEQHCYVDSAERALLESRERPIVLLRRRPDSPIAVEVAPNNHSLGVMLPYTGLHYLLLAGTGRWQAAPREERLFTEGEGRKADVGPKSAGRVPPSVLVMTSGNLSEEPIASNNDDARARLSKLADAFLMHDRDIRTRCDDSVVQSFEQHEYPLRRSRGYAPFPVRLPFDAPQILAAGGELKNTFCLTRDRYAFLSHHVGDLENYETLRSFEDGVAHLSQLFRIQPQMVAYDLHPDYLGTRYALSRAEREHLPAIGVQHHHAHIAACMAENGLNGRHPVIGVALDGTGYGTDGAIWGGEFLVANYGGYRRAFHLDYVPLPGGDKAVKEPWRLALVWLTRAGIEWTDEFAAVRQAREQSWQVIKRQAQGGPNAPPTSSMGRLFDAVAAISGIRQTVNYEAQAAIELEMLADPDETRAYEFRIHEDIVDPVPVIQEVVSDLRAGVSTAAISARFHNGVAAMVARVCALVRDRYCVNYVALSGGVWQNTTLLTRTLELLRKDGVTVYIHHQVPANDGGLALGQAAVAAWASNKK